MKKLRLTIFSLILASLLVLLGPATLLQLHSQQFPAFSWVQVGGAYRILWNYPFEFFQAMRVNNIRFADVFPGAEVGAQISGARADLPASGGTIWVSQKNDGSCYTQTSTVNFNTLGQVIKFVGLAPGTLGNSSHTAQTGTCINFTPTTATTAFVVDWGSAGGDTTHAGSGGFFNIQLINNQCVTNGGCASSAAGVTVGAANGGARGLVFEDTSIMGFGKGVRYAAGDSGDVGWGTFFNRGSIAFNTTGVSYEKPLGENDQYNGVKIIVNGTGIAIAASSQADFTIVGGSIDSNTTCGISHAGTSAMVNVFGVHWENYQVTNIQYVCDSTNNLHIQIFGGMATDDTLGGSSAQNWFRAAQFYVTGLYIYGGQGGRTYSGNVFLIGDISFISIYNGNHTAFPPATICGVSCYLTDVNHLAPSVIVPSSFAFSALGGISPSANPLILPQAPTISSGFGSSPSIPTNNGTAAFTVNVGTGGAASTGVIGLPTATNGWNCTCTDISTNTATVFACKQTAAGTATTVPIGQFTAAGAAQAWTASDILTVSCFAR